MIGNLLKWLDIYGHQININYQGDGKFKTNLGGILSLATIVLVLINTINLVTKFDDRSEQKENQRTLD